MEIINGTSLSDKCDYSFGDHMGANSIPHPIGGFSKEANDSNTEFLDECKKFEGKIMTLFIDNIRLYNRPIWVEEQDVEYAKILLGRNDLLKICEKLTKNKFIIFCSHEDTPIDEHIKLPSNVLGIHAVNAAYFSDKIHPFPYGLQRQLEENDKRVKILKSALKEGLKPTKLLYINCGIGRNEEREPLVNFEGLPWVTCRFDKDSKYFPYERYKDFLNELRDHKFMICPQGHGMDCHRNWETLYMRRVPIMLDHPYFRELMKGFPVLFVKSWAEVTPPLLNQNDMLYKKAQKMSLKKLDLRTIFKAIVQSYA